MKNQFTLPVFSAVILRKDHEVLLMKRCQSAISGGYFAFPGGKIDGLETITTATIREAQEEIGIKLDKQNLKFCHVMHVKTEAGQEYINFFFEAFVWEGDVRVMEPHKCDGLVWFDSEKLPVTIMPTHKQVMSLIQDNCTFSEFGW